MKDKKMSKLIQQFYEEDRHLDHVRDETFNKQITIKLDVFQAAELTGIAKVFNLPLSGLIAEIIEENLFPMIASLERQELFTAGIFYEEYLEKAGLIKDEDNTNDNRFQQMIDAYDKQQTKGNS